MHDFINKVFPLVEKELNQWRGLIKEAPDKELARQGLFSIEEKKFHALGGSIFALYNTEYKQTLTALITAYQTISDYLDNLCDRMDVYSEQAFVKLHDSMFDSMDMDSKKKNQDYYRYFPYKDDGGYLKKLVQRCKENREKLPGYFLVRDDVWDFIKLYRDLQVYKHMEPGSREIKLIEWYKNYKDLYPEIKWWEFSCASGSTLLVFALFALSTRDDFSYREKEKIIDTYFPWICGFHIMLDYYIDQEEDEKEGDLNLVSFYRDKIEQEERLYYFCQKSIEKAEELPDKDFHLTVVKGLIALYLSDPKVKSQGFQRSARKIIKIGGSQTWLMYYMCLMLRMGKKF